VVAATALLTFYLFSGTNLFKTIAIILITSFRDTDKSRNITPSSHTRTHPIPSSSSFVALVVLLVLVVLVVLVVVVLVVVPVVVVVKE